MLRKLLIPLLAATMLVAASASPAAAQQQRGLVNINVSDNTVQLPVAIAANVCGVTVAVLVQDLQDGTATCTAIANSTATSSGDNGGGGGITQEGLINVNISGNTVQVPIVAAANICGVSVLVLVQDALLGDTECDATAGGGANA